MLNKLYEIESNKELLEDYKKADKFMLNLMFIHWVLVSTASGYVYDTYLLGLLGGGMLFLITFISYKLYSGTPIFRIMIGIIIMTYTIIAIQQNLGRIEFHFHVFIALSFLTIYKDLLPATIASIYIAIHHILFTYLQLHNISIFDNQIMVFNYGCGYDIAVLHAVFVVFEWLVLYKIISANKNSFTEMNLYKNKLKYSNQNLEDKTKEQQQLLSLFDEGESVLFKWNNDKHFSVESVSVSVSKLLGYEQKDFLNNSVIYANCIHKDDIKMVTKEIKDASNISSGDFIKHQPYRVITKSGDTRWVLDYTIIVRDNDNINHFIGHISDITELRQKEEQIIKSEKMASMGEMIGNIAHQWRQPLSVISTAATGMKMQKEFDTLSDELFKESCDIINDNAQYLSKTIDDFRDFIKGDRTKSIFNLKDDINSFINLVEGSIKSNHINIILNLEDDININGFRNELTQCLINIFNNSKDVLKDIKKQDDRLVFISTTKENNNAIITIKDSGGGVPEDIIKKIFEPYFTTKHKSQGTGLGLHMTYNLIVDGMNGNIEASNVNYIYENKKYIGAQFKISLPS